jgi:endo-1,4-beta-mannosidase
MYPNKKSNYRIHGSINISILNKKYPVFIPIRNPLDSIASHTAFVHNPNKKEIEEWIDKGIKQYLNFYAYLKKYEKESNILFFDKFTKDISYIENVTKVILSENPIKIKDEDIKNKMNKSEFSLSLPRNNKKELDLYKEDIPKNKKYEICLDFFNYYQDKYYNLY